MPALYHRVERIDDKRQKAIPCYCQQVELPVEQPYRVTSTIKSKERKTDELIPPPTKVDLSQYQIRLPYPAEHKWASHIPHFATFPAFDTNRSDIRYSDEKLHYPKNLTLPNKRDDYFVMEKQRCDNRRHELMVMPQGTSLHRHVQWPDDLHWQVYPKNEISQTYPIPPKSILPNMPVPTEYEQQLGLAVSSRAANAARNYQIDLMQSVTHRHYSGLGERHPNVLDDYDLKALYFPNTERQLEPRSVDTMMPSAAFGGRESPAYKQVSVNQQMYRESTFIPQIASLSQRSFSGDLTPNDQEQENAEDQQEAENMAMGLASRKTAQPAESASPDCAEAGFTPSPSNLPVSYVLAKDISLLRRKQAQMRLPQQHMSDATHVLYKQEAQLATDQANDGRPLIPFSYPGMPTTRFSTDSFSRLQNSYPRNTSGHVMLDVYRHQKHENDQYLVRHPETARQLPTCTEEERGKSWREYLRDAVLNQRTDTVEAEPSQARGAQSARLAREKPAEIVPSSEMLRTVLTEREQEVTKHRLDGVGDALDKLRSNFLKTDMHSRFNTAFPEKTPNPYDNNTKGKRHHTILVN